MILQSEKAGPFIAGLENLDKTIALQSTGWFKEFRLKNLARFEGLPFPTVKDEEWKYTNIDPILRENYRLATGAKLTNHNLLDKIISTEEFAFVFVDGVFSAEFSKINGLPKGVVLSTIAEAAGPYKADIENIYKKYNPDTATKFTALNLAAAGNGAFIKISDKTIVKKLIHIVHITTQAHSAVLSQSIITLGKSSEASVLETYLSYDNTIIYLTSALTDIYLAENSTLHYHKAQSESMKAFHIGTTRVWQEQNSNFEGFSFMVGASITRNNLDISLNGEGISSRLNGLYCTRGTQLVDNHSAVDHRQPNCTSNQLYKGVLNDASRAVFNGKIFVRPIAQKTNSYQLNKNLLLGKDARIDTKPQLEIGADDVKCTHGATIGQLNEDEIFYLRSRSISKKTAVKMLCQGFVDDIINTIPNGVVRYKLNRLLEPTLASF